MEEESIYDVDPYKKSFGEVVVYVIRIYALVSVTLLTIRFFLELFAASPTARFSQWIYESSEIVMAPFRGIFPPREIGADSGSVLNTSVLFAIVIYMLLAYWMGTLVESWERKRLTNYKREMARAEQEKAEQEAAEAKKAATKSKSNQKPAKKS